MSWMYKVDIKIILMVLVVILSMIFPVRFFWSAEREYVEAMRGISEVERALAAGEQRPDGGLIYLMGMAEADGPILDPDFGLTLDALYLDREVLMQQWRRSRSRDSEGRTRTSYHRVWRSYLIDSSDYPEQNQNPRSFPIRSGGVAAPGARVGEVSLSPELLSGLATWSYSVLEGEWSERLLAEIVHADGARPAIHFEEPDRPRIGDLWIRFSYAPGEVVSAIGALEGGELVPYEFSNGESFGRIAAGVLTVDELLGVEREEVRSSVRFERFFFLFIGVLLLGGLFLYISIVTSEKTIAGHLRSTLVGALLVPLPWALLITVPTWSMRTTESLIVLGVGGALALVALLLIWLGDD